MPAFSIMLDRHQFRMRETSFCLLSPFGSGQETAANFNPTPWSPNRRAPRQQNDAILCEVLERLHPDTFHQLIQCVAESGYEVIGVSDPD